MANTLVQNKTRHILLQGIQNIFLKNFCGNSSTNDGKIWLIEQLGEDSTIPFLSKF